MKQRVTVTVPSVGKLPANLQTLALLKYYQQISNHTRIKSNNSLLLKVKPFCYKVMPTFVDHQKMSGNKESLKHSSSCLKPIAVESQLEIKYN